LLPKGAKGRARSPAVRAREAAEAAESELKKANGALKRARGDLKDAEEALKRSSKRLTRVQGKVDASERHLERVSQGAAEAPRLPGTATRIDPKLRRPNFSDFDQLPYHPPDWHTGMRTDEFARVGISPHTVSSELQPELDSIVQRQRAGGSPQALGHELEFLVQRDLLKGTTRKQGAKLRRVWTGADKKRISDVGLVEVTLEKRISESKFDQLWRDLQAINAGASKSDYLIVLTVLKLHPDDAVKLAKMAAIFERLQPGSRVTVSVHELAP
jgi:hypothetical protein